MVTRPATIISRNRPNRYGCSSAYVNRALPAALNWSSAKVNRFVLVVGQSAVCALKMMDIAGCGQVRIDIAVWSSVMIDIPSVLRFVGGVASEVEFGGYIGGVRRVIFRQPPVT